jgi:glycosyltransferase involved in cell wall biosynthesis
VAPVHVALNLVFLVPGETGGMEVYARELIPRLAARGDLRVTALVNREAAGEDLGVEARIVPVRARNRLEWVRGEQQHVPRLAAFAGCDLVHSLASTAPLRGRVPRITTIHDLNYKLVPEAHFGLLGLGMRVLVPAAARRSRRIIVDAESTRRDLAAHLRVAPDKVDVVPLAAAPPLVPAADPAGLRARLALGDRPVVLSASGKRPHPTLARLIRAVGAIPAERRPVLVIPGYATPHDAELRAAADSAGAAADVVFCAWLEQGELEGLYALAACVVCPSLYEGFGLPVLEAMVRGVPVASSDRSSLPEVAGDAALLFDPTDEGAIRTAIERLLGDPAEAERLRAAGRRRAAEFSWERTAELTVASYGRALLPSSGPGQMRL